MLKQIRKEKNSLYHDSFYRNKKRTSPLKWLILVSSIIALSIVLFKTAYANQFSKGDLLNDIGSGQMLFSSVKKESTLPGNINKTRRFQAAVLLNSSASFEINGLIASVTLTQSFINQSDNNVNGIYAFPLPENSAVNHLHIQVADRIIEGKIMEKAQAKKIFEQAKRSGKKASLVQQYRPNLFTNHIANIAAHEQVTVTIKYFQHIDFIDGKFSLRFPMKITPRYQPSFLSNSTSSTTESLRPNLHSKQALTQDENLRELTVINKQVTQNKIAEGTLTESTIGEDNSTGNYINESDSLPMIFQNKSLKPSNNINLAIKLNAGVDLMNISSPSHRIQVNDYQSKNVIYKPFDSEQILAIEVGNVQVAMDRDFILQWQPNPSNEPRLSVFKQKLDGEIYSLAMLLPPTQLESTYDVPTFARDITFIIDTSGSMQGQSIKQAKQSLFFALQTLKEKDSFNIIAFESSFHQAFSSTVMATQQNILTARKFISSLHANGGTEMVKPLAKALAMPTTSIQEPNAIKQIIFITDGAVSNELALFKLIHNTQHIPRLFTVGIGAAPNGYFMRKAAQFGRGSYTYIGKVNEVNAKMSALLEKISRPALRNINVQFQPLHLGSIEQYPKKIPDLYYGEPLTIAFKTAIMPNSMQIFGEQANKGWHQEVSLSEQQESVGITPIWAKAKIEDLLDGLITGESPEQVRTNVLATSLSHQVMSPYSSFIAVEQEEMSVKSDQKKQATPFPKTATGWKAPFFAGFLLLILSLIMQARRAIRITKKTTNKQIANQC